MSILEDFKKLKQKEKQEKLRIWDIEYYQNDNPSISDEDYDACLQSYNAQYKKKYVSSLGKASDAFAKYEHAIPVLSLDKVTTKEGYNDFIKKFDYNIVVQPKLDGLTVVYYPDGKMVSRGDGHIGEVLPYAYLIPDLPAAIDKPVRMEVVITFDSLKKNFPNNTKNARNIAAGILRRKEKSADINYLSYYAYNILGADDMTEAEQIDLLEQYGFKTPQTIAIKGEEECKLAYNILNHVTKKQEYPTDGTVIKANIAKKDKDFGLTSHHPNNAFAYKFVSAIAETTLKDVEWSIGRGKFTPVAIFDSVKLGGSIITRASLHNLNIVKKFNIKIGSKVKVTLKNEIIPQIIESDGNGTDIKVIEKCPYCSSKTIIAENGEVHCSNLKCESVIYDTANKLVSRDGLEINGISEEAIAKILTWIKTRKKIKEIQPFEILKLTEVDLKEIGFTAYMAAKIRSELTSKTSQVSLPKFLYSCNIQGVGASTAKDIASKYKDINDLCSNWEATGKDIDGIGDVTFESVKNSLAQILLNSSYVNFADNKLYNDNTKTANVKTIVITGKLSKPKKYYEGLIAKAGYNYSDNLTKTTDYLVAANINGKSSKLEKARKNGISVISEETLLEMLG